MVDAHLGGNRPARRMLSQSHTHQETEADQHRGYHKRIENGAGQLDRPDVQDNVRKDALRPQ